MTIHRRPACGLAAFRESLLSAGSDGTMHEFPRWVRCLASRADSIFAGLETGVMAVLTPKLELTRTIQPRHFNGLPSWQPAVLTGPCVSSRSQRD
jgi:hypothetical protein